MVIQNKGGQFYLIAAVIIIVAVIGIVGVRNYASTTRDTSVLDLSKELQLEGESVVNYGIVSSENLTLLLNTFATNYGNYVQGKDNEFIFVYADANTLTGTTPKINVLYSIDVINTLSLELGGSKIENLIISKQIKSNTFDVNPNEEIKINVGNSQQTFKLNEGQNFYFIIKQPVK